MFGEWISVNDRLPEKDTGSVLIYTEYGQIAEGQYFHSMGTWKQFRWNVENAKVTDWILFPDKPRK